MKVKEAMELLSKQNQENELYFNSPIDAPDANIPVGVVYENRITMYTLPDGSVVSMLPENITEFGLSDKVCTVLTDKVR